MKKKNTEIKTYGIIAEFQNPHELLVAASKVYEEGYRSYDSHSPFPIHGMDKAMRMSDSKLGWIVITFAILGAVGGFSLQAWSSMIAYPFLISGKPLLSTEAFIPITFETTILFSSFSTVFGMLILNKMFVSFYHPIFKSKNFVAKASSHGFFISIEAKDPQFESEKTSKFLTKIGGKNVEVIED